MLLIVDFIITYTISDAIMYIENEKWFIKVWIKINKSK